MKKMVGDVVDALMLFALVMLFYSRFFRWEDEHLAGNMSHQAKIIWMALGLISIAFLSFRMHRHPKLYKDIVNESNGDFSGVRFFPLSCSLYLF
ncbi:hypothetical protein UC34_05000 [Pandoraea vervacti]|uniref:Uncharacterized protein n=1 Tax=Pandoraea vervacti TaxID=656178 RepID=A0ABM5SVN7_9BURK|nr:hypothetical protein UC34_05000 [Pandoraea vervacti]